MQRWIPIVGNTYGKLTVLEDIIDRTKPKKEAHQCKCLCECGNITYVYYQRLVNGDTKSCGCLKKSANGMCGTKFHRAFKHLKERCNNPHNPRYKHYGGRGIKCLWNTFQEFYDDMYESYLAHVEDFGEDDTSIDRIDVDGDYCKENCKWSTFVEQANNKQSSKVYTLNGETHTLKDWSIITGINLNTLRGRLFKGWTVEDTLTKKVGSRRCVGKVV